MSDSWKCPHCQNIQEKSDQLKIMAEAKRTNAIVFANVTTRAYPCRFCRETVDIGDVANGRFDSEDVAVSSQSDSEPMNPIAGFFGGALLGFIGAAILGGIWRLFRSDNLPVPAVLVIVGIGAVGCTILALRERK